MRSVRNVAEYSALHRRLRIHQAVVAARDAGMVLVAGNQEDGVVVAIGVEGADSDFSEIVDLVHLVHLKTGARRDQSIQVHERTAILPQKRSLAIRHREIADNLL
jgi:hypothetical protein